MRMIRGVRKYNFPGKFLAITDDCLKYIENVVPRHKVVVFLKKCLDFYSRNFLKRSCLVPS